MNRKWQSRIGGPRIIAVSLAAMLLTSGCASNAAQEPVGAQDIEIAGARVFPESVTSDAAGNIYVGSMSGTIYRAVPGSTSAEPWVTPSEENKLQSLFGVFVDSGRGVLWTCSNPPFGGPPQPGAISRLVAFDLATAGTSASYDFPADKPSACNDIAVAADGSVWASETSSGRIFVVKPGAQELTLFAEGQELVGIDGLAFADDGTLYINNVRQNLLQRVKRKTDGSYDGLTNLTANLPMDGPDGLRSIGGNRFLQAEGTGGRVALVEVSGDSATITPINSELESSAGVTRVGPVGYATEGKINYLFDPSLQGKDPGTFHIRAFPLPEGL